MNNPIITEISGGYCTIPILYDRIAETLGLSTEKSHYDCTKVEVSPLIMESVFTYYREKKVSSESISMWWFNYGPKAVNTLQGHQVRVYDGWYISEDSHEKSV